VASLSNHEAVLRQAQDERVQMKTRDVSAIVVDAGARVVRRGGHEIRLAPKAFDLLLILIRHQPNVVPHHQLHAVLWPGVHVSETSLAALVTQLRKALGDASGEGRVIRTLHRVGYAFVGDATVTGAPPDIAEPVSRLIWRGTVFDVPAGESDIGRDRVCAIQMDADSVSRRHARLRVSRDGATIEDLGSKNGTWIDGERIHGAVALADGATFRLGSETVRFELSGDPRPTKTAAP
jgi:DNA-binding winged helix-turn-helix (wHTH) protein